MSYYSSTVFSNPEGDTSVSDEGAQGLGNTSLFSMFFGVFLDIANYRAWSPSSDRLSTTRHTPHADTPNSVSSHPAKFPWDPGEGVEGPAHASYLGDLELEIEVEEENLLTSLLPDPGYFIAGGIAGAVSRTATAPLDRLKVYLIAQTDTADKAAATLKSGAPISAARTAARPLVAAISTLWGMGGVRSLFAGMLRMTFRFRSLLTLAGNGLNVLKVMPESAIKFGSYEVRNGWCKCRRTANGPGIQKSPRTISRTRRYQSNWPVGTILRSGNGWRYLSVGDASVQMPNIC